MIKEFSEAAGEGRKRWNYIGGSELRTITGVGVSDSVVKMIGSDENWTILLSFNFNTMELLRFSFVN